MVDQALVENSIKPAVTRDEILTMTGIGVGTPREVESRFQALNHYLGLPVPDRVTHLWRYSDPATFFPRGDLTPHSNSDLGAAMGDVEGVIVYLIPGTAPKTVTGIAARRNSLLVEPLRLSKAGLALLGTVVPLDHGVFESLNGALWSTGVFIDIPEGVRLDAPIRVVHRADLRTNATRVVIRVGRGADVKIVETLLGGAPNRHVLSVTEVVAEAGARIDHALIQDWEPGTIGHVTNRATLARDAVWQSASIGLGGDAYKADFGAFLDGPGAESNIVGVSLSRKKQHMDFHTVQFHRADHTRSKINFKTALAGKSTSVYTALIHMAESAVESEAYQENRNLMLSDRARSHTIPELEIMTSEVQCSHAATSAPLNEEELFYLRCRGIPESVAIQMLVRGFFEDALSLVPDSLRGEAEQSLMTELKALSERGIR